MYTVQELIGELQKVKDKNKEILLEIWDASTNELFQSRVLSVSEDEEGKAVLLHADLLNF